MLLLRMPLRTPVDSAFAAEKERDEIFGRMRSGAYLVVVRGAKHMSFSDAPLINPMGYARIAISALTIRRAYVDAFFDTVLYGKHRALLSPSAHEFPKATLRIYCAIDGVSAGNVVCQRSRREPDIVPRHN